MPTEIDGLPLHPLIVHAPVVLVPLLVLAILGYVLVPPLRQRIGWAVIALAVVAPAVVFAARWSGQKLSQERYPDGSDVVSAHAEWGDRLLWATLALLPIVLLFGALERGRRAVRARNLENPAPVPADEPEDGEAAPPRPSDDVASGGRRLVMIALGVLMLAGAAVSAYLVFKSGDSGARMIWGF